MQDFEGLAGFGGEANQPSARNCTNSALHWSTIYLYIILYSICTTSTLQPTAPLQGVFYRTSPQLTSLHKSTKSILQNLYIILPHQTQTLAPPQNAKSIWASVCSEYVLQMKSTNLVSASVQAGWNFSHSWSCVGWKWYHRSQPYQQQECNW